MKNKTGIKIKTLDELMKEAIGRWEKVYDVKFEEFEKIMCYRAIIREIDYAAKRYAEVRWTEDQEEMRKNAG